MKRSIVFLLALLSLPLAPGWAQPTLAAKETRRVLVLFSQERGHPAHDLTEQGIRHGFRSNPAFDVELYLEYLDVGRFSDPSHAPAVARFLRKKYAGRKIDVIISVYPAAVDFLLGDGNVALPGVPIVACAVTRGWAEKLERSPSRRHITGVIIAENPAGPLHTAKGEMIKPINHRKDRTMITSRTKILLAAALVCAVAFGAGGISTDAHRKKALSD